MSDSSSPRISHQGTNQFTHPTPKTLLESSIPPPQYPINVNRLGNNPIPATYPSSRMYQERQQYPVVVENPGLWECFTCLRPRDLLEFSFLGTGAMTMMYFKSINGKSVHYAPILAGALAVGIGFPYIMWMRAYNRLVGTYENAYEQKLYGMDSGRQVTKIVRKRVMQSKEDDPEFMDKFLNRVDNGTYDDMRFLLDSRPDLRIRMEADGLTEEDFAFYPSQELNAHPKLKELYRAVVGNTPDLQKFFLEHPDAVKVLRDNPWALQEYEHGNRFLAKMYRIWSSPEVHDFLQEKPAYISSFMYNKMTWNDLVSFASESKTDHL